jgi:cytochrome c2
LTGFRIWGSESSVVSGLARVRPTGEEMPLPIDIAAHAEGIVLRFGQTLDRDAARNAGNYVVQSYDYRRSHRYGSGHYRRDGEPGHDALLVDGVQLGRDGRSVLLRVGRLRPVMQVSVRFSIAAAGGAPLQGEVFATLPKLEPIGVSLTKFHGQVHRAEGGAPPGSVVARASIANGAALFRGMGCAACHSTDGSTRNRVGPSMKALFGRVRELSSPAKKQKKKKRTGKGKDQQEPKTVRADVAYLRRSILQPAADLVKGYTAVMPSYAGVLRDEQIESLLLFLRSLE